MWRESQQVRLALLTLVLAGVAWGSWCFPGLGAVLVFDRAAILDGEWWRLATGPLVHFSFGHLVWDVLVFVAAGWAIAWSGFPRFGWVCAWAFVAPGLLFLATTPELARYGGLSGPAMAAVAYLSLHHAVGTKVRSARVLWLAMLGATVAKTGWEVAYGSTLFVATEGPAWRVVPAAHLVGILGALLVFAWTWREARATRT